MNSWLAEWSGRKKFLLLRYEDLRRDPEPGFRQLLGLLGEKRIDQGLMRKARSFSDFGQMQKMEATGAFGSKIIRPGDATDLETFKVRQGKVGGFVRTLSPNDQRFAAAAMRKLDSRFGYGESVAAGGEFSA